MTHDSNLDGKVEGAFEREIEEPQAERKGSGRIKRSTFLDDFEAQLRRLGY